MDRNSNSNARFIFGDALGDPIADEILRALRRAGPDGLTRWDISNLFVIGASTFPNSGAANPTPTILALTYRTADTLVDRYLKKPEMLA